MTKLGIGRSDIAIVILTNEFQYEKARLETYKNVISSDENCT